MDKLTDLGNLKSIGPSTLKKLKTLGINSIKDLLSYFPARYLDFTRFTDIKNLTPGEVVTVRGTVKSITQRMSFRTRTSLAEAIISDNTGSIKVVWFNQGYIAKQLKPGDEVLLSGKAEQYKGLQLTNPVHEKISEENIHTGRLVPVYKLPDGLYNRTFRNLVSQALPEVKQLKEILPPEVLKDSHILDIKNTVSELHFPSNWDNLKKAQTRIIFEEVFIQQLAVEKHKLLIKSLSAPNLAPKVELTKNFLNTLPFKLTDAQKKSLWKIMLDFSEKHPMNRLLQGDVGSGKTIVALTAALSIMADGFQVALVAPTEVLAKQHYDEFIKLTSRLKNSPKIAILTRNYSLIDNNKATKKNFTKELETGKINLLVGTHAIIQPKVKFNNLAFVIIDEQHRFGVEQRAQLLLAKHSVNLDKKAQWTPHLLSMSATPIPRTLALSLYSDLEVSTLDEIPKGRKKIITKLAKEQERNKIYNFIETEIQKGRQAFVIAPLVEDSEASQTKSVKAEFEKLQKTRFSQYKVGLLYGSMKGQDKESVMSKFKNKELDILVATSVIEIGIDIPNASVIAIENSENFGLAQLHQLRGRVGRGMHQSYCFLFLGTENETSKERLEFFSSCDNGFKLAEMDLKQRGFGSLFGKSQTGFSFKYGRFLTLKILDQSKTEAVKLIAQDPTLSAHPKLNELAEPLVQNIHLE